MLQALLLTKAQAGSIRPRRGVSCRREIGLQRARFVAVNIDLAPAQMIVRQLHAVIEIIGGSSDVQDVDEAGMRAREMGLEC